jgi:hypothetical protein
MEGEKMPKFQKNDEVEDAVHDRGIGTVLGDGNEENGQYCYLVKWIKRGVLPQIEMVPEKELLPVYR